MSDSRLFVAALAGGVATLTAAAGVAAGAAVVYRKRLQTTLAQLADQDQQLGAGLDQLARNDQHLARAIRKMGGRRTA